jgi:hypothetical protein
MELLVRPAAGDKFVVSDKAFPITVDIVSERLIEIAGEPVVSSALLIKSDNPEISFGFSESVTRFPGEIKKIDAEEPYCINVDVFRYDEDFIGLVSGEYHLQLGVTLFVIDGAQDFRVVELSKTALCLLEISSVSNFN